MFCGYLSGKYFTFVWAKRIRTQIFSVAVLLCVVMQSFRPIRSPSGDIVVCSSSRDRNTELVVCRIDERKKIKVKCIYVTAIISYLAIVIHVCCYTFSWEPMTDEGASWEQHRTTDSISPPEWPGGRKIHKLKKIYILFTAYTIAFSQVVTWPGI